MPDSYTRIAIVTGATSGIGEATVRQFITAGFGVIGNGRTASRLAALENELGSAFLGIVGDATDEAVLESLFTRADEHFGKPVDIVIANAGRGLGGAVSTVEPDAFRDTLNINVTGALTLLQKAARRMEKVQLSHYPDSAADIVVIGSVVGRQGCRQDTN